MKVPKNAKQKIKNGEFNFKNCEKCKHYKFIKNYNFMGFPLKEYECELINKSISEVIFYYNSSPYCTKFNKKEFKNG